MNGIAAPLVTLVATLIGGLLVILANWITERWKARADNERQMARNAALMTAVFVIRNFVAEALFDASAANIHSRLGGLKAAQGNLNSVIEKSPPEVQYIMAAIFGISLRLGDLVAAIETHLDPLELTHRHDLLCEALEEFDVYAQQDLELLSADEIKALVENPEDVPDD